MMDTGIPIGVAVALTGEYAEPYGIPMQRGLELSREEMNSLGGPPITFVSADPMSTVEGRLLPSSTCGHIAATGMAA